MSQGDVVEAKPLLEDVLVQFEALEDSWGTVVCLTALGISAQAWGDPAAAAAYFERVGFITAELRLPAHHQAHHLANLAIAYRQLGRHEAAFDASNEALRLARESGRHSTAAFAQSDIARHLLDLGDVAQAAALVAESLLVLWEIGNNFDITPVMELAAAVMSAGGPFEPAVRLFAAAAGLREAMPCPIGAGERATYEHWLAKVGAGLEEPAFTRAWTAGKAQSLSAAIAEARAELAKMAR